jgi:hypothetical protein
MKAILRVAFTKRKDAHPGGSSTVVLGSFNAELSACLRSTLEFARKKHVYLGVKPPTKEPHWVIESPIIHELVVKIEGIHYSA